MHTFRVVVSLVCALCVPLLAGCNEKIPEPAPEPRPAVTRGPQVPEPAGLKTEDLAVATGGEAKDGDKVKGNCTGRLLKTNFMFDTSVGKKPFDFTIGAGGVIKGWDQGVPGMKV